MSSKAPEYIDQFAQIERLLEQMRQADQANQTADTQDVIEKDPARGFDGPAHRTVDVRKQYRDNLQLAASADLRNLGQNVDTGKTVPKVFESPGDNLPEQHHASTGGVQTRPLVKQRKKAATEQVGLPGWVATGLPGSTMAAATKALENLRKQSLNQPTHVDTDSVPASSGATTEQQYFDATQPPPENPDVTHVDFEYPPGGSAYDTWLAEHGGDVEVQSGTGSDISDTAYGVTITQYSPTKKA